jgi:hypothetical protein
MMQTSTHGNFQQSLRANTHRRSTSGIGIIATPLFPYDNHSVWNRNQLGALDTTSIATYALLGVAAYWLLKHFKKV